MDRWIAWFWIAASFACSQTSSVDREDAFTGNGGTGGAGGAVGEDGDAAKDGAGASGGAGGGETGTGQVVHRVTIEADGSFRPAEITIRDGDAVEWILHDRSDTVIPTAGGCRAAAFDPSLPNQFAGPLSLWPSGIFVLGPLQSGLTVEMGGCSRGTPQAVVGNRYLCPTSDPGTMASTWASPSVTGVFVRLLWSDLQPPAGAGATYDFSRLDAALDAAVANGKLVSLGIKAGDDGTPDWIFSTNADGSARPGGGGGVVRLALQDGGSSATGCGPRLWLGSPTDRKYQELYFAMLRKVAAHVRSRADWYRAVAYVKPSGANLFSHENRLPKRCQVGCICNTQVFAENGFTPSGLRAFYDAQYALLADEFPGKALSFALIQDGWPSVNDQGDYERSDGSSSGGPLPSALHITESLLDLGQSKLATRFVVQHNGLAPHPMPTNCSNYDQHPGVPPFRGDGPCPNRWVLQEGAQGQVTGFQTSNDEKVSSAVQLESALQNLWHDSDGVFLEIYEDRAWEADELGVLDPASSGRTLVAWRDQLDARRRSAFPGADLPDPFPLSFRYTLHRGLAAGDQVLTYANGTRCDENPAATGRIVIAE